MLFRKLASVSRHLVEGAKHGAPEYGANDIPAWVEVSSANLSKQ